MATDEEVIQVPGVSGQRAAAAAVVASLYPVGWRVEHPPLTDGKRTVRQ